MDPALEGGAEISGPETNQGGGNYENRRRQIGAQTYRARTSQKHAFEDALAPYCRGFLRLAARCLLATGATRF